MSLSFSALSASESEFVIRVCDHLHANYDEAQVSIYGDGSASPNGEKFAATREGASWRVCFDFNRGACYHTAVQLPSDWALMGRLARRAA
jgi:hypothetical protein